MRFTIAVLACLLFPPWAAAQGALPRNDAAASLGWAGSEHELRDYDRWRASLFLSVSVGRYWTDHLKTDIEAGWSSPATTETYDDYTVGGLQAFAISNYRVRDFQLAIGQSYQFGRNDWVHPYIGVGADVVRRETRLDRPTQSRVAYNTPSRAPVDVTIPAFRMNERRVLVRPFVKTGLKMYASERMFFATELKLGFAPDLEHAIWKLAAGFDF